MNLLSKDEYLRLLESVQSEEDYQETDYDGIPDDAWIPAEPVDKAKIAREMEARSHGVIDVLKYRKEQIRDAIYKCMNLQVGEFIIHIRRYNGHPKDKQLNGPLTLDINLMQERYRTPSGAPCKMQYTFNPFLDNRFTNQPWLTYFDRGWAKDIPVETMVDIIRWMQALRRMTAFL